MKQDLSKTKILYAIAARNEVSSGVYRLVNEQHNEFCNKECVQKSKFGLSPVKLSTILMLLLVCFLSSTLSACYLNTAGTHSTQVILNGPTPHKILAPLTQPAPAPTLSPAVRKLDSTRFAGSWYELAAIPVTTSMTAERCACTVAHYAWQHTHFAIATSCWLGHATGHLHNETAVAYPTLLQKRLHYRYFGASIAHQHIWFYYVDDLYRYAILGTPDHKHLWIYARTPEISDQEYQNLVALASSHGFDVRQLQMTDQSC